MSAETKVLNFALDETQTIDLLNITKKMDLKTVNKNNTELEKKVFSANAHEFIP